MARVFAASGHLHVLRGGLLEFVRVELTHIGRRRVDEHKRLKERNPPFPAGSSVERAGLEPATSGLQTHSITRPHLTVSDRTGMAERLSPFSSNATRRRSPQRPVESRSSRDVRQRPAARPKQLDRLALELVRAA